jgi:hypothetical protein
VPQLSINPGDSGDETIGLDSAQNRACIRIDLVDLPIPIFPDPERSFRPRKSRVAAVARGWNRGEHAAGLGINLVDAILGNLKKVFPIESRSRMRRDIDRALHLPARRIKGVQLISRGKPDIVPVISDTIHSLDARKGAILTNYFGG